MVCSVLGSPYHKSLGVVRSLLTPTQSLLRTPNRNPNRQLYPPRIVSVVGMATKGGRDLQVCPFHSCQARHLLCPNLFILIGGSPERGLNLKIVLNIKLEYKNISHRFCFAAGFPPMPFKPSAKCNIFSKYDLLAAMHLQCQHEFDPTSAVQRLYLIFFFFYQISQGMPWKVFRQLACHRNENRNKPKQICYLFEFCNKCMTHRSERQMRRHLR